MRQYWVSITGVCIVLVAATVFAYWSVTTCDFITFDDPEYVYRNRNVLAGLSWPGWKYAWTTFECSNWHPLTWLSLELDISLWGLKSARFHAVNLAFHLANVLLMFVILFRLTNGLGRSACAAALFALHPMHVESVAWVSERKDVLSTFFLFLTIGAYLNYVTRPSTTRYLIVFIFMTLGLLAKPMLVTMPILLILLDWWPLNRMAWHDNVVVGNRFARHSVRWLIVEKLPLFCVALADALITITAQRDASKVLSLSLVIRIANMFYAYLWYLEKTILPTSLTVFYRHPEQNLTWSLVGLGILAVVGISIWVLCFYRTKPHLTFGWFWFVTSLLPVIGLVQVGGQAYADRYAYIPHIGLLVSIVWEAHARLWTTQVGRVVGNLALIAALIACISLTRTQVGFWKNNDMLWSHVLEVDPNNAIAHQHLADARYFEKDYPRTIKHLERTLELKRPASAWKLAKIYYIWGTCLIALNRPGEAIEKLQTSLKLVPNQESILNELTRILNEQGRHDEAAQFSARSATLEREAQLVLQAMQNPHTESAQLILGQHHARLGNFDQAIVHFQIAIQLSPQSATAYNNLALAQAEVRRFEEAKTSFLRTIELNPKLAVAHFNLARLLEAEKDLSGAKKHFAEAFRLDPADYEAKQNLDRLSKP